MAAPGLLEKLGPGNCSGSAQAPDVEKILPPSFSPVPAPAIPCWRGRGPGMLGPEAACIPPSPRASAPYSLSAGSSSRWGLRDRDENDSPNHGRLFRERVIEDCLRTLRLVWTVSQFGLPLPASMHASAPRAAGLHRCPVNSWGSRTGVSTQGAMKGFSGRP